ncbi:MAG: hypothetical protein EAZ07_08530 [Cytophagales bacterium]|nr:MAG: hypothetical protein EAZ07_08530 [Cytophagales bacterium]
MNKPRFLELVRDPNKIEFFDLEKLEEVVELFPYFQAAHLLIAKITREQSSIFASDKLNKAAVCSLDRKNLKRILNTKQSKLTVFINNEITEHTLSNKEPSVSKESLELETKEEEPSSVILPVEDTTNAVLQVVSLNDEILEVNEAIVNEILVLNSNSSLPIEKEQNNSQEHEPSLVILPVEDTTNAVLQVVSLNDETLEVNEAIVSETLVSNNSSSLPIEQEKKNTHSDFYSDLERNLAELKKKKEEAIAKLAEEDKAIFKEEITQSPNTIEEIKEQTPFIISLTPSNDDEILKEKQDIEPIAEKLSNINQPNIEISRLEDILISGIEDKNKIYDRDLLIEYFNYLTEKRLLRLKNKKSATNIIDQFISKEPTIPKLQPEKLKEPLIDLSEKSAKPKIKILSENFAKILILQGKIEQAIEMYQELSLKNPEKKLYFANLITELKNKNNIS